MEKIIKNEWHVIGRGLAGWHATGVNVSSSGGDIIDRPWWAGGIQYGYLHGAIDGCLIYDASQADDAAFSRLVISGPIVNPELGPDEVSKFERTDTLRIMLPGLGGSFQTLAAIALADQTFSGLDYVGVNVYRALLSQVPGIKIGTVTNGIITWES